MGLPQIRTGEKRTAQNKTILKAIANIVTSYSSVLRLFVFANSDFWYSLIYMKLVLLSVIMFASETSACSCMMPSNQDAFCFADFVSHIKIKSIETIKDDFSLHYTVEHLDIYKAPSSAPLSCDIYTSASSASCGIDGLVIGQELLVIGSIDENQKQRIYICGQFQEGIYWNDIPASFKKQLKAGFKCPATTRATRY